MKRVAVLIHATGGYIDFVPKLIDTCYRYLFVDKSVFVSYFVFTDTCPRFVEPRHEVRVLYTAKRGWPEDATMRYQTYLFYFTEWESFDFVFSLDADLELVGPVKSDLLDDTKFVVISLSPNESDENKEIPKLLAHDFFGGPMRGFADICHAILTGTIKTSDIDYRVQLTAAVSCKVLQLAKASKRFPLDILIIHVGFLVRENEEITPYTKIRTVRKRQNIREVQVSDDRKARVPLFDIMATETNVCNWSYFGLDNLLFECFKMFIQL